MQLTHQENSPHHIKPLENHIKQLFIPGQLQPVSLGKHSGIKDLHRAERAEERQLPDTVLNVKIAASEDLFK